MQADTELQGGAGGDDPLPVSPDPLSPGRTDVNPSDRAGVDELPENDGETPLENVDEELIEENMPDTDPDNAELDDQQNPR
jgi:hypothetical protein